ncbi:MAG: methyltransferase domain-containing protein [Pelolinea sp.]|nr:methyltransferase domain-containing protein [Pelolinea sp.]
MSSEHSFWHARYQQQAGWTLNTRRYIFGQIGISLDDRLIEVGSGSGAVLESLARDGYAHLCGIDLDLAALLDAKIAHPNICADGMSLPFSNASFSHSMCHFFLLWVSDPLIALQEMARVTKPGGWVLALAEPDYGGRISCPDALERLADLQTRALAHQGADIHMGRRLISLFTEIGLEDIFVGIIPAQCGGNAQPNAFLQDRDILNRDLAGLIDQEEFEALVCQAEKGSSENESMWFVPIFYAFGQVPRDKTG